MEAFTLKHQIWQVYDCLQVQVRRTQCWCCISDGFISLREHKPLQAWQHQVSGWKPQTLFWCRGVWFWSLLVHSAAHPHVVRVTLLGGWRNWYHWLAHTPVGLKSNKTPVEHYVSVRNKQNVYRNKTVESDSVSLSRRWSFPEPGDELCV